MLLKTRLVNDSKAHQEAQIIRPKIYLKRPLL